MIGDFSPIITDTIDIDNSKPKLGLLPNIAMKLSSKIYK